VNVKGFFSRAAEKAGKSNVICEPPADETAQ